MDGSEHYKDQFIEMLLSMSLPEILDVDLYKYQVEKKPDEFESVDKYMGSYIFPLLEEIRAELASVMETIYKSPFAEVSKLIGFKADKFRYAVQVDNWRNGSSNPGKDPYTTKPGDILLFSSLKLETVEDLGRDGCTYTFAYVRKIDDDLGGGRFQVIAANQIEIEHRLCESNVVFLTNVTTYKRLWSALSRRKNLNIIENVLSYNELAQDNCDLCTRESNINPGVEFGSALLSNLNEAQNQAISATLVGLGCNHKPSVHLIWGPPGTGKTWTVSVLLYILLRMNIRTLICAPTNMAITELASRVVKLVKDSCALNADIAEKGLAPCDLSDILIFGNKDNLKIGSEIEDIFLDYRVDRLVGLLGNGWKHCVASMIDYLEHCVQWHQVYWDNIDNKYDNSKPKSLVEYARDRFKHTASPLRESMLTLLTHVSRKSIAARDFQYMVKVLSLLDSFERLLFDKHLKSKELQNIFSHQGNNSGSESTALLSDLFIHLLRLITFHMSPRKILQKNFVFKRLL